jgi:carbon-monoxide dehydrogenase small subunit
MIMSAKALLDKDPEADQEAVKHALAGNICRCTGYVQILESVAAAGRRMADPHTDSDRQAGEVSR